MERLRHARILLPFPYFRHLRAGDYIICIVSNIITPIFNGSLQPIGGASATDADADADIALTTGIRSGFRKKALYLNPNERKVNQQIKSKICANRFYDHIEEQKTAVSEYLDKTFGRWHNGIGYDT
jgi:hypothetical protein